MSSSGDAARYPDRPAVSTDGMGGLARSAGVVGGATLASRLLGLLRDVALANVFDRRATDAFFIAFTIPNLFRRLVGEGTLTVAFVPIFTGWLQRSQEEARRFFNATWTLAALVGVAVSLLGILFAEPIVRLFAAGFASDPEKFALCVRLLQICFPYILLISLVAVAMGALNSVGHFFAPAIAPVLLNLSIMLACGAVWAGWVGGEPIVAVAFAVVVGGGLQVLAQLPALRANGLAPRPVIALGHPAIRRLLVVMAPAVLGASVYQFNLLVVRFLSSFMGDGAVSYLFYADRLIEFPLGVFIFAIGTASLPSLSLLVKRGEFEQLRVAFSGTLALAIALALPSTVGLVVLREPLFSALFAWNPVVFGAEAIQGCARALLFYAVGLVPISVSRICVQLCLSHENTSTPARAAAVSLVVNAIAALMLIGPLTEGLAPAWLVALQRPLALFDLGYAGLALATSCAAAANALYLCVACRRRYRVFQPRQDFQRWLLIAIATALLGVAVMFSQTLLPVPATASFESLALLFLHVAIGAGVFAVTLALLRSPEFPVLRAVLRLR